MVFVTAIYPAREEPLPGVTAALITDVAREELNPDQVHEVEDLGELRRALKKELRSGDVFITLGAGDVFRVAHDVAADLERSHVDA